LKKSTESGITT